MRSIGFLGLGVDEKHGSLHAALVLHGKEGKTCSRVRKGTWKQWSPENQAGTFGLFL